MQTQSISDNISQNAIVNSMLLQEEHIVHVATISPGIYWKGIAALIAAVIALFYGFWLAVYFLVVAAVLLLVAYSTKKYLVLAATDHRVIICGGILSQEVVQLRYSQIESVDILYTLTGNLFNYSCVIITGTGMTRWRVSFVQDGEVFRDKLMQKLLEREEPLRH